MYCTVRRVRAVLSAALLLVAVLAVAQDSDAAVARVVETQDDNRVTIARSAADYPVTPGDTYVVQYVRGSAQTELPVAIDATGIADLGVVGTIDTTGLTLPVFRDQVRTLVERAYPGSFPRVTLQSIGIFRVRVSGELAAVREVEAWGLDRLSAVVGRVDTSRASERRVTVVNPDGTRRDYDLFRARRLGEQAQDPLLRPGDTVVLSRPGSRFTISGAVRFPGQYELTDRDTLSTALNVWAGGLLSDADRDAVRIVSAGSDPRMRTFAVSNARSQALEDGDRVIVPRVTDRLPVVTLEGAIGDGALLRRLTLFPGAGLRDTILDAGIPFPDGANLRAAVLIRDGGETPRPIDLESILFGSGDDVPLEPNDRIVVPFGAFSVYLTGEVAESTFVSIDDVPRLSDVVSGRLTAFGTRRAIEVTSSAGATRVYDLFAAERDGEAGEDPVLAAGDVVRVPRRGRLVTLSGEVERPGTYELVDGDTLDELLTRYGGGLTLLGEPTDIRVVRVTPEETDSVSQIRVNLEAEAAAAFDVRDQDSVVVGSVLDQLPVVSVEGAVNAGAADGELAAAAVSDLFRYRFTPGETIADLARAIRGRLLTTADLSSAFLVRAASGEVVSVDLARYLFGDDPDRGPALERNDRLVVPFRQYFVTVSGSVAAPGQYPYIPNRTYDYYLGLAGGTDPNRHWGERPRITSVSGDRRAADAVIQPEDDIFFNTRNPLYFITPVISVVGTIVSTVTLILSLSQ